MKSLVEQMDDVSWGMVGMGGGQHAFVPQALWREVMDALAEGELREVALRDAGEAELALLGVVRSGLDKIPCSCRGGEQCARCELEAWVG